jgi:flagellar biosynthesis/type III secretory pathway ATPase
VFAELPKLLERSGNSDKGSITAIYTVLVAGDDMNEPVADEVRSILDGHIILSRELAARNHYPAINILESASRVMSAVTDKQHRLSAGSLRDRLATYAKNEDLILLGAYKSGTDQRVDDAIAKVPDINAFLKQATDDKSNFAGAVDGLMKIFPSNANLS